MNIGFIGIKSNYLKTRNKLKYENVKTGHNCKTCHVPKGWGLQQIRPMKGHNLNQSFTINLSETERCTFVTVPCVTGAFMTNHNGCFKFDCQVWCVKCTRAKCKINTAADLLTRIINTGLRHCTVCYRFCID